MLFIPHSLVIALIFGFAADGQDKPDWQNGIPEACTSITVGKLATFDGSVMPSHTHDSHRTRT
ncbi:MAG: dipeptidase [Anaerophaga sp.]|nr:dipeptidase [Anaerophaga sp.]